MFNVDPSQVSGFNVLSYAAPIEAARQQEYRNALSNMVASMPSGNSAAQYNALGAYGGPTQAAANSVQSYNATGTDPTDWLRYANSGAIRSQPISSDLQSALSFLPEMGVTMEVFSGGQAEKGSGGPRTGSTRHDHGNAADVFFYKDGRKLDWANPQDRPLFEAIVQRAKANGVTGFGAGPGYMQPGSMHIGFGNPAVWGAGGSGSNAPGWLTSAYNTPYQGATGGAQQTATTDDLLAYLGL